MLGLFLPAVMESDMHQHSKQRTAADNQFLKLQTRSLARSRMASDLEAIVQKRADNTARLRGLRLAKEQQDQHAALAMPSTKKRAAKAAS